MVRPSILLPCVALVLACAGDPCRASGSTTPRQVILARTPGTLGGTASEDAHVRVFPGDPPACFDVAFGPLSSDAVDDAAERLGIVVRVAEWKAHRQGRNSALGLPVTGFEPLADSAGITATWLPPISNARHPPLAPLQPAERWFTARLCLAADASVQAELWFRLSAPLAESTGESGADLAWSDALHVAFGRGIQPDTMTNASELRYRAERLQLHDELADLAVRLAKLSGDDRWFGVRGDALGKLGRHAEALDAYRRAAKACALRADGRRDREDQCIRYLGIVAAASAAGKDPSSAERGRAPAR
jgi:hypothetical protein